MFFGWEQATVRDKRVRQALSVSIARDEWIEAQYNTRAFESQGLPVEKRWNSSLQALDVLEGWWLDPRSKAFGPNAKYYEHNVADAKKLLSAAGYGNEGPEITSNHFTSGQFGTDFPKLVELWEGMAAESGIRFKKNIVDYSGAYLALRDTNGKFGGVSYKNGPPAPTSDATDRLSFEYTQSGGVGFHGFDLAGKGDFSGDPYLETELRKARFEVDTEKRRAIVHDVQRYLAGQIYSLRWPGGATAFELVWPSIRNFRVYWPGTALPTLVSNTTWWLDDTQAPLKKS
jgi:ABC-type transport system substrate-binding protein